MRDKYGDPVFNSISITLICEECDVWRKLHSGVELPRCKHVLDRLPPWKDPDAQELISDVLEKMGKGAVRDRELLGVTAEEDSAFGSKYIDALKDRSIHIGSKNPEWILTSCDPNGAGEGSDTCILSAYYKAGKMIICGIDSHPTRMGEKEELLKSHIAALRSKSKFKNSKIIFLPELNNADGSQILTDVARSLRGVVIWNGPDGEGVRVQKGTKLLYTRSGDSRLVQGSVFFDTDMICGNPYVKAQNKVELMKSELIKQLRQWKFVCMPAKNPKGNPWFSFSGKTNDEGQMVQDQKDDVCICFLMNTNYAEYAEKNWHNMQKSQSRF